MRFWLLHDPAIPKTTIDAILATPNHALAQIERVLPYELPVVFAEEDAHEGVSTDPLARRSQYVFVERGAEKRIEASLFVLDALEKVVSAFPTFSGRVAVLTDRPLTTPISIKDLSIGEGFLHEWVDVFGMHLQNRGLVVSTYGLTEEQVVKLWRHETAHIVLNALSRPGLNDGHCTNADCLFKPLYDVGDIDSVLDFCAECSAVLAKYSV